MNVDFNTQYYRPNLLASKLFETKINIKTGDGFDHLKELADYAI